MKLIVIALMMSTGVLFGILALVTDLGYGMAEQGTAQNGADSGALAGANILASSVGNDTSDVAYVASDKQVYDKVVELATANYSMTSSTASPHVAVAYLPWIGPKDSGACQTTSAGTYSAYSDGSLVPSGSQQVSSPANIGSIPVNTCAIRVTAKLVHNPLFGNLVDPNVTQESETAVAVARVFPVATPTTYTGIWPITRWLGAPGCSFDPNNPTPCTFWDSNGIPNGSFKFLLDLSKCSSIVGAYGADPFGCAGTGYNEQRIVDYDHGYPGTGSKQNDIANWILHGWSGTIRADQSDLNCYPTTADPNKLNNCQNSRLELYNGQLGQAVKGALTTAIGQAMTNGKVVHVFLWNYGETNLNCTPNNLSQDHGTYWPNSGGGGGNGSGGGGCGNSGQIERVIVDQVQCFRFYGPDPNSISGYFVSCTDGGTPTDGAPSTHNNTVALVG